MGRHCLVLDEAVDEYMKDRISKGRGISFFGAAFASDESPPASSRFTGYRFQVTYLYVPWFSPQELWEQADTAPMSVQQVLCDVCHCPGKDGQSVLKVITQQLMRLGLSLQDVVSGVGDGGGENEGALGIHSSIEAANPGYVRRRCLGHLSWRTADAAIDEMGVLSKHVLSLCAYLHEGITWRRLQAIASQPVAQGGLNLLREGSAEYRAIFGTSLGNILENRPETMSHFLLWLLPREEILRDCVAKDVVDRGLADGAQAASRTLLDPEARVFRAISAGVLEKCLFMFRWGKKAGTICATTSLADLTERSLKIITSVAIDDTFLGRFGIDRANLVRDGLVGLTWTDVLIRKTVPEGQLREDYRATVYDFHSLPWTTLLASLGCSVVLSARTL